MGQTFSSFSWPSSDDRPPYVFDRTLPFAPAPLISFNLFTQEVVNIHPVFPSSSSAHRRRPVPKSIDSDSQSDDEDLIPKPMGAAGHPGRGGYKLTKALNWHRRDYHRFRDFVKEAAQMHLDMDKSLRAQSRAALRLVTEEAINKFPKLFYYEAYWPLTDCLRSVLKSEKSRKRRLQKKLNPVTEQNPDPEPDMHASEI